jgi:molybdopterin-binding protein
LRTSLFSTRPGVYARRSPCIKGSRMKLSTRNRLPGTVVPVAKGEAMAVVKIRLDGGVQVLTSSITRDAADDLGLTEG